MDVVGFLKMVPAAIGIAGLLTYFMRKQKPASDLELANFVENLRNAFILLGCGALIILSVWLIYRLAPPNRDAALWNSGQMGSLQVQVAVYGEC